MLSRDEWVAVTSRMGRNLLSIQHAEMQLKALLPLIDIGSADHALDGLMKRFNAVQLQTMGHLVGRLKANASFDQQSLVDWLDRVVGARNTLAHHFLAKFATDFAQGNAAHAIEFLEVQLSEVKGLRELTASLLREILLTLREATFSDDPEMKQLLLEIETSYQSHFTREETHPLPNPPLEGEGTRH